ncbi:RND transporter [Aquicoccus sp. SCR17]|jgi:Cu/Ag efflux protein CusF|nr:RND transporter [Carideicomes alvinocaridis]
MKNFVLTAAFAVLAAPVLADAHLSKGTITKIDRQWNKLTIDHGPLANLDMPAMKMVFQVADAALLADLQEGDEIEFAADRVDGKLTVVEIDK